MNRYVNRLKIITDKNSPRYYNTELLTSISIEDVPFYYITREGDRLDTISNLFYKTPTKWWILAKANNQVNGSLSLPVGTKLFIPNNVDE